MKVKRRIEQRTDEPEGAKGQERKTREEGRLSVQLLRPCPTFLLDVPLWISDLQYLYGRESLGFNMQRRQLAVPGLRHVEAVLEASD
jgi:hypothetical protein